jgi:hypothetical protein
VEVRHTRARLGQKQLWPLVFSLRAKPVAIPTGEVPTTDEQETSNNFDEFELDAKTIERLKQKTMRELALWSETCMPSKQPLKIEYLELNGALGLSKMIRPALDCLAFFSDARGAHYRPTRQKTIFGPLSPLLWMHPPGDKCSVWAHQILRHLVG